jgi:hypothetical protein
MNNDTLEYTNECYQAANKALNELIANIIPAPHAAAPLSFFIENMKQSIVAMHMNARVHALKSTSPHNKE